MEKEVTTERSKTYKEGSKSYYTCAVSTCCNTTVRNKNITFFSFPVDAERRAVWLKLIGREELMDKQSKHCRVCEIHFDTDSLLVSPNRKVLKKNSVPKRQLPDKKFKNKASLATVEKTDSYTQCEILPGGSHSKASNYFSAHKSQKRKLENNVVESRKRPRTKASQDAEKRMFNKLCDKFLTKKLSTLVKELAQFKLNSPRNRCSIDYKLFCLNLFNTSPRAYYLLSDSLLNMPSKAILRRMFTPITTKVNGYLMKVLNTKVDKMNDVERNCSIVIDAVSLKTNLFYNISEDKVYGFHEVDGIRSPVPAKYALVVMIRGIFHNYKIPVGFALLAECKHYESVTKWIDELIESLFLIGLNIRVFVTDIDSDFTSAKRRQISTEEPYFFVGPNKIFYISDPPHLMTLLRNDLLTYNFHFDNHVAKWNYISQFYDKDRDKEWRNAPKLTESHIKPNDFERTSAKLAVQVLSRSVAAGLTSYKDSEVFDATVEGTIELIRIMNDLFDLLNSSTRYGATNFQDAFSGTEHQITFLNEMMKFFGKLKMLNPKNGRDAISKTIVGFLVTIRSIKFLFEDLKEEGYSYILTKRLNLDCSKIFFDRLRSRNWNCKFTDPTSWQLVLAFRKFFIVSITKPHKDSDYSEDTADILIEGERLYKNLGNDEQKSMGEPKLENVSGEKPNKVEEGKSNNRMPPITTSDYNAIDLPEKNALLYTCGYLFKKCLKQHKDCDLLEAFLESENDDERFGRYKDYCNKGGRSFSIILQDDFIQFIEAMEEKFCTFISRELMNDNVLKNLLAEVEHFTFTMPCPCFPVLYLKKLYLRMRLYYTLKHNNRTFRQINN